MIQVTFSFPEAPDTTVEFPRPVRGMRRGLKRPTLAVVESVDDVESVKTRDLIAWLQAIETSMDPRGEGIRIFL